MTKVQTGWTLYVINFMKPASSVITYQSPNFVYKWLQALIPHRASWLLLEQKTRATETYAQRVVEAMSTPGKPTEEMAACRSSSLVGTQLHILFYN